MTVKYIVYSKVQYAEAEVDKIDVDKLKTVCADLGKPINAVQNNFVKKN